MWQQFTQPAREAVWRAQAIAVERKCAEVEGAHLFLGVIAGDDEVIATLLQVSGVAGEEARLYAASALQSEPLQPDGEPTLSPDAKRIFRLAFMESNRTHKGAIGPEHLLIACVAQQRGPHLGEVLRPLGLDAARLREHLRSLNASKTPYKRGNPLNSLTEQGKKAIEAAHAAMRASFCGQISTAHLLLGLLGDEEFGSVETLQNIGVDVEDLKRRARESIVSDGQIATPQKKFSPGAKRALERASREAKAAGHGFIGTDHLLRALLPQRETWREKLKAGGQNFDSVEDLWTAEEVAALKLKTSDIASQKSKKTFRQSTEKAHWAFGACGFFHGLWIASILLQLATSDPATMNWIWIIYGTSALLALGVGSHYYTSDAWLKIFRGWFMGLMMGTVLFVHL